MVSKNPTDKELRSLIYDANKYGERIAENRPDIRRRLKKKDARFFHRSKLPDGQPVYFLFCRGKKGYSIVPAIATPSKEPDSKMGAHYSTIIVQTAIPIVDKASNKIINAYGATDWYVISGHAIKRYIERHNHVSSEMITQQMVNDVEEHIMLDFTASFIENNGIDDEIIIYFDGGGFFGNCDDNIFYLRTFNMNRMLFPNQRLQTLSSEKEVEKLYQYNKPQELLIPII